MLERINKTNDIKKLNLEEKKILADEIREYIISVVSKNGGHLASNLGVVELTIALESVFDLTKDKIVWDVGHQCYVHKILNGRKKEFENIRKFGGISGFPKIEESSTDCFNTGHSSTSISASMGLAKARDLKGDNYHVIAVIGDGALTGGMALEALNHVGWSKTKMIIILNDNEMSISKNNSGINNLLTNLRSKKKYRSTNKKWKRVVNRIPIAGNALVNIISRLKDAIKQMIVPGMYFEEIGIKYLGPIDGHNIEKLEQILEEVKEFDEPVLLHIITKKGKGYTYAEENPSKFHGIGKFDIETGESLEKSSNSYSKVFGNKLVELADDNKKIVAITAAMKDGVGLSLFASKYPSRFFDVGIAEGHALTFAAGLAKEGMIPFVSIYSSFYQRAYDQIIHDICIQNLPVIMCVDRGGIVGADGATHQGLYDLSFFKIIPNLIIMAPSSFKELEMMMEYAITLRKPVVIHYPKGGEETAFQHEKLVLGKTEIIKKGSDITILGIGKTVLKVLEISKELEKQNIKCEVINVRFLKPFSENNQILESIKKTKKIIVLEDSTIIGGLGSSVKELFVDHNLNNIYLKIYAYPDRFIEHGSVHELEHKYKIDNEQIIDDIKKLFLKNKKNKS